MKKQNVAEDLIIRHGEFTRALYRELGGMHVEEKMDAGRIRTIVAKSGAEKTAIVQNSEEWITRFNQAWFRSAVRLVPAEILKQVEAPFLAINGDRDIQTTAKSNLEMMQKTLQAAKHPDFETVELKDLNHLFQTCATGAFYEYPVIEETFAPVALETIGAWLDNRFQA
ncbi:MAG: hypothetical protein ABI644_05440 [Arenimonas sp.]